MKEEPESTSFIEEPESKSLLGRRIVIVVPIVFVFMFIMVMLMLSPAHYQFKVSGGQLGLCDSKMGFLVTQKSKAVRSIPVGNADFGDLLARSFDSEIEALNALNTLVANRIKDRAEKLIPLEKQIAGLYTDLVGYLRVAEDLGSGEKVDNISALQGWLDNYQAKLQRASKAK